MRIGVSAGSNDLYLIPFLKKLINENKIQYVELYIRFDITIAEIKCWRNANIPLFLHAPHNERGEIDLEGLELTLLVEELVDLSPGDIIVFDAGINQYFDYDRYISLHAYPENMPAITAFGDRGLIAFPIEVQKNKFVLDFCHATITALQHDQKPEDLIQGFLDLNPKHFHLNNTTSDFSDQHSPLDEGVVPVGWIINNLPENATITLETGHDMEDRPAAILHDLFVFNSYRKEKNESLSDYSGKDVF